MQNLVVLVHIMKRIMHRALKLEIIIIKFAHSVKQQQQKQYKIITEYRHWPWPTQVLKHLRVALKHKHKTIKTRIQNVQVTS